MLVDPEGKIHCDLFLARRGMGGGMIWIKRPKTTGFQNGIERAPFKTIGDEKADGLNKVFLCFGGRISHRIDVKRGAPGDK